MSETTPGSSRKPPDVAGNSNEGQFIEPPKRKRGRPPKQKLGKTSENMSIISDSDTNSFGSLSDDDPGETIHTIKKTRPLKVKKPPPVVVHNLNPADIENKLNSININKGNITRRLTKSGTKLFVTTNEEFKLLKNHLETSQTNFYTYTLDEDKVSRYVMYGLPDFDVNQVRQAIATSTTVDPIDVKKMIIKKPLYQGHTNYLIYFKKTSRLNLQSLKLVNGMFGYRIYWDTYKKSNGPVQCHNCQEYFHSSRNCRLPSRCMRCGGSHKSSDCSYLDTTTKRIPDQKVKCVNCQGKHTSNSKDCPLRQQIIRQREQALTQKRINANQKRYVHQTQNYNKYFPSLQTTTTNNKLPFNKITPNMTYSATVGQHLNVDTANTLSQDSNLFSPRQLMQIFNEMINICSKCKSKSEQLIALTAIFEKYMFND